MRTQQPAATVRQAFTVPSTRHGVATDPTGVPPRFGVSATSDVEPTDWTQGTWVTPAPLVYHATALFGPDGIPVTVGANYVWLWLDLEPESDVTLVDVLNVPAVTGAPDLDGGTVTDPNVIDGGTPTTTGTITYDGGSP